MAMISYIGFCGKAGVGKTTACNILQEIHKGPQILLPWAYDLKRIARKEFGWDGEKDDKGRKLLQTLGTECGRMYGGELFWVNKWQAKVDNFVNDAIEFNDKNTRILVLNDDIRFNSEAERIKFNGGVIIELTGRGLDLGSNSSHSSETGIDDQYIDITLDNSATMESLRLAVSSLV